MENGVSLEIIWFDQDLIEVIFRCSNGRYSGSAEIYLNHGALCDLAKTLQGFPSELNDSRHVELGTFDQHYADGGVKMDLRCSDSKGHPVVEIQLRGDGCRAFGELESVALRIPIEPAAVDSFVQQLIAMDGTAGASASLRMAT